MWFITIRPQVSIQPSPGHGMAFRWATSADKPVYCEQTKHGRFETPARIIKLMYLLSAPLFRFLPLVVLACFSLQPAAAAEPDPGELKKACDSGDGQSCYRVAAMYEQGIAVEKDLAQAATHYEKACTLGAAAACYDRAVFAYDGTGEERDPGAAARYFERACELGEIPACLSAGLMHVNDQDLPVDAGLGLPLLKRACEGGMAEGCHMVTIVYLGGSGIAQDKQAALNYARKGCSLKLQASCSAAEEIEASM